jgi:hypothetical protein
VGIPLFIDQGLGWFDLDNRPYTADIFEDEPSYVADFSRA